MREMSEERLKNWNKRRGIDRERGEHIWGGGGEARLFGNELLKEVK